MVADAIGVQGFGRCGDQGSRFRRRVIRVRSLGVLGTWPKRNQGTKLLHQIWPNVGSYTRGHPKTARERILGMVFPMLQGSVRNDKI